MKSYIFVHFVITQGQKLLAMGHYVLLEHSQTLQNFTFGDQEIFVFAPNLHVYAGHTGFQVFGDFGLPTIFLRAQPWLSNTCTGM